MTVYEMGFLLSAATTLMSKFVLCVLPAWMVVVGKTCVDVERAIVWGWKAAFEGKWPMNDHLGRPLTPQDGTRYWMRGKPLCGDTLHRIAMAAFKARGKLKQPMLLACRHSVRPWLDH